MGTRADFYVGRGEHAEWLGSIAYDGYPDGIDKQLLNCASEEAYRHAVGTFLGPRRDKTLPDQGWPWPWETSDTTDYAYAFEGAKVHATCFGGTWFDPLVKREDDESESCKGSPASFPNMKERKQRAKFGEHCGIMIIGVPK